MNDIIDAVFDDPVRHRCAKVLPSGARCTQKFSGAGKHCLHHQGQHSRKMFATTIYLRHAQHVWLRDLSDVTGDPVALLIRRAIDEFRERMPQ